MTFKTEFFEKEYDIPDGYLAVKTRACSARINVNLDCFEKTELEKAWLTYEGCTNVFVEHTYTKTDDDPAKYDDGIVAMQQQFIMTLTKAQYTCCQQQTKHMKNCVI